MSEKPQPKNRLEELQAFIKVAPESIADELSRTPNSWLASFKGHLDVIDTYLQSPRVRELLTQDQMKEADLRIEKLKEEADNITLENPDEDTRQGLLSKLDIFKKEE